MSVCKHCKSDIISYRKNRVYCSLKCQQAYQTAIKIRDWKIGKEKGWTGTTRKISDFVRNYLLEKFQYKCTKCDWGEKHPITGKIPLEVNHVDGNAENCKEENLEILCPNCHSLTPNFRNLNKNKSSRMR